MDKLAELYRYRELFRNLTVNELKLRYRRSVLGFIWTLLNPLLMMTVMTVVFSRVMRFNTKDYAILLFAGLLPWTFFSQAVNLSLMSIVGKGPLLKKVYIPKSVLPLSAVAATLINSSLAFIPLLLVVAVTGHPLTWHVLFVPIAMLMLGLFACGWALLFSCLNVFFRDFGHMTDVLLQAWFYASPIIYTIDMIPEQYRDAFAWNPLAHLIACFREPIYNGAFPSGTSIAIAGVSAVATFVIGLLVFWRYEKHFVMMV